MTKNPITISPMNTLEDALLLMHKMKREHFRLLISRGN